MLIAATSSSRIAIQARPMRESRSLKLMNSTTSASPSAVQYHGPQVERREALDQRDVDLVDRRDAGAAVRPVLVADPEDALVGVDRDAADDLAERERHDRDVVAAQAQRREAQQRAERRRRDRGHDDDDQPVQVDAGLALELLRDADVDVRSAEPARRQPAHRVRADRVERDVAEVEQAGEADHDVQPERHHHVHERDGRVVDEAAAGVVEERQQHRDDDRRRRRGSCWCGPSRSASAA